MSTETSPVTETETAAAPSEEAS
ncbi:MAG TPA: 30S ribosomal protein Ycf65, partial [Synechococcales bacterium UBA12195]|nr:30S ribosomal protein Ycf65 [Synechococcales bacterium UBA12195]